MKGMSLTLKIIITVVVILIAAFTVLGIFAGGIGQAGAIITQWLQGIPSTPPGGIGLAQTCAEQGGVVCGIGQCAPGNIVIGASDISIGQQSCCKGSGQVTSACQ